MEIRTVNDMFRAQVSSQGGRAALRWKSGGVWRSCTWRDWDATSRTVAGGLVAFGVAAREKVAMAVKLVGQLHLGHYKAEIF